MGSSGTSHPTACVTSWPSPASVWAWLGRDLPHHPSIMNPSPSVKKPRKRTAPVHYSRTGSSSIACGVQYPAHETHDIHEATCRNCIRVLITLGWGDLRGKLKQKPNDMTTKQAKKQTARENKLVVLQEKVDAALEMCNVTPLDSKELSALREKLSRALDALTEAEESP